MSPTVVMSCYGSAAVLALYLLWHFGAKHWYWHVLSVAIALTIGLMPMNATLNQPVYTLVIGWTFLFLFLWGIAAPVVAAIHHPPHWHFSHHHR